MQKKKKKKIDNNEKKEIDSNTKKKKYIRNGQNGKWKIMQEKAKQTIM